MGHNEQGTGKLVVDNLKLTDQATNKIAETGVLCLSGAKLVFYNGSAWEEITSS